MLKTATLYFCFLFLIIFKNNFVLSFIKLTRTRLQKFSLLRDIAEITDPREYDSLTRCCSDRNTLRVFDFQKSQCRPCKRIAPELEELSQKYVGKVQFFKIDADSSKDALNLMKAQGVRSVPTFHVWCNSERVDIVQGAHLDELENAIESELIRMSREATESQ
jgi:thioredoxin 1